MTRKIKLNVTKVSILFSKLTKCTLKLSCRLRWKAWIWYQYLPNIIVTFKDLTVYGKEEKVWINVVVVKYKLCWKYNLLYLRIFQTLFTIQGDPNVPARQLSIEAHLNEPMILSKTQQETLGNIEELVKEDVIVTDPQLLAQPQPFVVPYGVHDRGMREVSLQLRLPLNYCRRR